MLRRLLFLALVLVVALPLGACGRKAAPLSPEGSEYPHRYPAQ